MGCHCVWSLSVSASFKSDLSRNKNVYKEPALGSLKSVYGPHGPDLLKKPAHDNEKCVDVSRYKLFFTTNIYNYTKSK